MTPLSVIHLAPSSIDEVDRFAGYVQQELENGSIDPLDVYARCKGMIKAMEACISILQDKATEEAEKHGKTFNKNSVHFEVKEVGTKYIFDNCNYPAYFNSQVKMEQAKADLDAKAKFLKGIKKPTEITNEDTGEVYVVNPPVKTSKTSVTVELK